MSVGRQLNPYSGMRFDIPHLRSIESSVSYDFDSLIQGLVTGINQPYVIRGFEIVIPNASITASSLEIKVADSAILHASASEAGTMLLVSSTASNEVLSAQNSKVIGAFQNNVANYVSLAYTRVVDSTTVDQTAGWSQAQKTEYQRTAALGRMLEYRFVISTSGFGNNLPLYIVGTTSTGAVSYITKATPSLFRLGRGGSNPNPYYSFNWKNLSNSQDPNAPRKEWINTSTALTSNPVTVIPGDSTEAFLYGDFCISNFKEWMDAVMSRFKEVTGSSYWYTDSTLLQKTPNLFDVWHDSVGSVMTGVGQFSYNVLLETATPSYGSYQSVFTDSSILPGDSYIVGATSNNSASVTSFNLSQLVINSLVREAFTFNEVLYNRRIYRPNLSSSTLIDFTEGAYKVALWKQSYTGTGSAVTISSWSYTNLSVGSAVTLNVGAHTFKVGDYITVTGLLATNAPFGLYMVKGATAGTLKIDSAIQISGSPTVSSGQVKLGAKAGHPFIATFAVSSWSYVGTAVSVVAPNHSYSTGDEIVVCGLHANADGIHTVTVNSDRSISFTASSAPTGTPTVSSSSFVQIRKAQFRLTITDALPNDYNLSDITATAFDAGSLIYTVGPSTLPTLSYASGAINFDGIVAISEVSNPVAVSSITYGSSPITINGSSVLGSDTLTLTSTASVVPGMTVSGTGIPSGATVLTVLTGTTIRISAVATVTGATSFSFASPYIEVTCASAHGYSTITGPISFTIYGNEIDSKYITTYASVSLIYVSDTVFRLTGSSIFDAGTYTNSGDSTYARYPNNPYPGPVQWSSDIIIKSIIGDKYFRIPQTATATGTDVANKFNINGQTGTVYLQDGEVAYILIERNESVALGATYSTNGGSTAIIGSAPLTDINGSLLRIGDFLKFEEEDEAKWFKISNQGFSGLEEGDSLPSGTSTVYLVADNGQSPSVTMRPSRSGKLVYTKGTYSEVKVAKHYAVDSNPDVYWFAVRRDNGATKSRVYLKSLELEAGEVRTIADNAPDNLLIYTGAKNEATINPNYTTIDSSGQFQQKQTVLVGSYTTDVNTRTRSITFQSEPDLGFKTGDKIVKTSGSSVYSYTIEYCLSNLTVVVKEDISALMPNDSMTYYRVNYAIEDSDNLTLAIRKEDRELAKMNTVLNRTVYDESVLPVTMTLSANSLSSTASSDSSDPLNADQIMSGAYIYIGSNPNNPTALAWVLHGTKTLSERVEGALVGMPGGKFGDTKILIHVISGTFTNGATIKQVGRPGITRIINGASAINITGSTIPTTTQYSNGTISVLGLNTMTVTNPAAVTLGATITGLGIQANTTVVNISGLTITLDKPTIATSVGTLYTFVKTYPSTLNLANTTGLAIGMAISGPSIQSGTVISSIGVNSVTMSKIATSATSGTYAFLPANAVTSPVALSGSISLELVLPPNKRTQILSSEYIVWPSMATYKASADPSLCGEELMVIINDSVREAEVDYRETFGGPKGKIQILRDLPINSRLRFRILPAYGSVLAKAAGAVTLQIAYDGGNQISILTGRPVYLNSIEKSNALRVDGSIEIDANIGGTPVGGIMPATNKSFDIGSEALKVNKAWLSELFIKTHDSYPSSALSYKTWGATTVGNSGTALSTTLLDIDINYAMRIKVNAIARRSDGTLGIRGIEIQGAFYRTATGIYSAGDPYTLSVGTVGDGYNYAILFGVVGNQIGVVAYGNGTVEWAGSIEYQKISLPA